MNFCQAKQGCSKWRVERIRLNISGHKVTLLVPLRTRTRFKAISCELQYLENLEPLLAGVLSSGLW